MLVLAVMSPEGASQHGRENSLGGSGVHRIVSLLTRFTENYIPSSFSIACILTLVVFCAGILIAGQGPLQCLHHWGQGFWVLLKFAMQMSLMLVTGYMVALSPWVNRMLARLAQVARTPTQAVVLMAVISMLFAWFHWGLGLIVSSIFLRYLVRRQPEVDYRVMVAVAYFGLGATWHAGLSASAPLLSATPGHFLEDEIGVVPLTATVFSSFNLILSAIVMVALAGLSPFLQPSRKEDRFRVPSGVLDQLKIFQPPQRPPRRSLATLIDYSYGINLLIGLAGAIWLLSQFATFRLQ